MNLPGVSGLDVQQKLAKAAVHVPIIFLTGHGDIPTTVRAVKAGAVNFLTKPYDDEELLNAIEQSATYYEEGRLHLETEIPAEYSFEDMVGKSNALRKVMEQVAIVAPTDSTVLLHGETGTGKELVARALHSLSPRKDRNLVRLNCAAIPAGLVESELFGHEKGAFTGALIQKRGRFELADNGTLFLDEIGDISLDLQPKLLRALQEHEFERLGSTKTIRVDARLIAATHRDLWAMIREGKFREDLFYRLNVFPIEIPPLRERREDIPLLVHYFVARFARLMEKRIGSVPARAMDALANAPWPGNIRELENFIERCVILTRGDQLLVPTHELVRAGARAQVACLDIPRGGEACDYQCTAGLPRTNRGSWWRGRTSRPEAHHIAEKNEPAEYLALRLQSRTCWCVLLSKTLRWAGQQRTGRPAGVDCYGTHSTAQGDRSPTSRVVRSVTIVRFLIPITIRSARYSFAYFTIVRTSLPVTNSTSAYIPAFRICSLAWA